MTTLLKCPICGGTERSLLPSSVCEECGCDMKPDASDARRVLFDKSQPKEARMAAMNVLQPKPAQPRDTPRDAGDAWQPIETAPKDGTLYLCWVDAVRYDETDEGQPVETDVSDVDFGQWRDFDTGGVHENMMGRIGDAQHVTHWMPLPRRPTAPPVRSPTGEPT